MVRPHRYGQISKILTITGAFLSLASGTDSGSSEPAALGKERLPGRPLAIAVKDGRATFDLPTPQPGRPTLVIVSALARARGPYPIRLTSRPTDHPKPIVLGSPARPVRLPLEPSQSLKIPPIAGLTPSRHKTFHLIAQGGDVAAASSYVAVLGQLEAVGKRIQIYVDVRDAGTVDESTVRDLISTFDEKVFPEAARRFGPASDVDHDGRFTVLFSSWLSKLAGGKVAVDGFVRGADLDPQLAPPFGNRCDMMYLSTRLKAGPHLRTIVAHEYMHAVTFSRKVLSKDSSGIEEEGWLDEALAHLVEDSHGFSHSNIDYRVSAFLSSPESYRLVVEDYYAADLFRSHGNRGATYLFLRWCVDRYGPGLLEALVRSERRGVANLEAATGTSFAELFRSWTIALYLSGLDPALAIDGSYRSIDLRGHLDEWILAGPRTYTVEPSSSPHAWMAEGTTTHYVVIEASANTKGLTIEVDGPDEASIQVTAMTLPEGLSRPELKVRRHRDANGQIHFLAEVTERDGRSARLEALSWEPLVPLQNQRSGTTGRGHLDQLGITRNCGNSLLEARSILRSGPIPMPEASVTSGPTIFKAVGTDPLGRRLAAWTLVDFHENSVIIPSQDATRLR